MPGINDQLRRYGKYEFRRLMRETRRQMNITNLRPEFEVVPGNPIFKVKCRRCGKVYTLNQSSAHRSHAVAHTVDDRVAAQLVEASYWWLKVRGKHGQHWRRVEIVRAEPGRGWLVGEYPFVPGCRRWWVRNPDKFGGMVEDA